MAEDWYKRAEMAVSSLVEGTSAKLHVAVSEVEKGDDELAKEALTRRQTSVTKAWEPGLFLGLLWLV